MKEYIKPLTNVINLDIDEMMVEFDPNIPLSGDPLVNHSEWNDDDEESQDFTIKMKSLWDE